MLRIDHPFDQGSGGLATQQVPPCPAGTLELRSITKRFPSGDLFADVSAVFQPKSINAIMGPNGAGKSTLIRCLLGLESHEGSTQFDGVSLRADDRHVHAAFEDSPAHLGLTGRQNLSLFCERTDLDLGRYLTQKKLSRRVSKYSYGERKKLSIMAALMSSSSVIILDEPTNGLDRETLQFLAEDLRALASEHLIIILGHDLRFMEPLCDETYFLANGSLQHVSSEERSSSSSSLDMLYDLYCAPVGR